MSALSDYYNALDRLIKNQPINVAPGGKINKDTVALEAGRKRGSIKPSREGFAELIADIESAQADNIPKDKLLEKQLAKTKSELKELRKLYLKSLNREIMLNERVRELEAIIQSDNILKL